MAQTIIFNEGLINEARRLTGLKSDTEVIELALRELIHNKSHCALLELAGRIDFAENFDHKSLRALRDGTG